MGPTKRCLFKFDFPSAKFWVDFFFWLDESQSQKTPRPSHKQSLLAIGEGWLGERFLHAAGYKNLVYCRLWRKQT